jgi:hypothetical protein
MSTAPTGRARRLSQKQERPPGVGVLVAVEGVPLMVGHDPAQHEHPAVGGAIHPYPGGPALHIEVAHPPRVGGDGDTVMWNHTWTNNDGEHYCADAARVSRSR